MSPRATLVSLLTAAAAVLATLVVPPAHAGSIPVPDEDPFYAQPAGLESVPSGAVLDSRPVTVLAAASRRFDDFIRELSRFNRRARGQHFEDFD